MLKFTTKGIYCVPGKFYVDPWRPVDKAVITHGHADHARPGMAHYLCHHFSVPILRSRIGPDIKVQGIGYGETIVINGVKVSLHPAGHIVGSSQVRMEHKGRIVVVTGDYKLQDDGLSTVFEPVRCHEIVTESTFGLPIYRWSPIHEQQKLMQQWIHDNQQQGKTSVFFGYSLGKAQRIMQDVQGVSEIYVHYSIARLNEAMQSVGIALPDYQVADLRENTKHLQGKIFIAPPSLYESNAIKKIPNAATAICSGWMQVRGARRWRSADNGFPLSDHADWNDLLRAIKASEAEKVYVTHGQVAVFTKYLNENGWDAEEIKTEFGSEEDPVLENDENPPS